MAKVPPANLLSSLPYVSLAVLAALCCFGKSPTVGALFLGGTQKMFEAGAATTLVQLLHAIALKMSLPA